MVSALLSAELTKIMMTLLLDADAWLAWVESMEPVTFVQLELDPQPMDKAAIFAELMKNL